MSNLDRVTPNPPTPEEVTKNLERSILVITGEEEIEDSADRAVNIAQKKLREGNLTALDQVRELKQAFSDAMQVAGNRDREEYQLLRQEWLVLSYFMNGVVAGQRAVALELLNRNQNLG